MAIDNQVGKFLWDIAEKKNGFSFGKPWKNSEDALGLVIPILRKKKVDRKYIMIQETEKVEIVDQGTIDTAKIESKDDRTVFIRSGVILAGDTQERGVTVGTIVSPHAKMDLSVRCVHASKGIQSGAGFKAKDVAPPSVYLSLMEEDQRGVWDSVQKYSEKKGIDGKFRSRLNAVRHLDGSNSLSSQRMGFSSNRLIGSARSSHVSTQSMSSDDLLKSMEEVESSRKTVEGSLKDIPCIDDQVGAIIFNMQGVIGFEVYDAHESWAAMHEKILTKYDDVLLQKQEESLFELKEEMIPKKISEFIETLMASDTQRTFHSEQGETHLISGEKHIGEYTIIDGAVMHIIAFKRKQPKPGFKKPKQNKTADVEDRIEAIRH